MEGRQDAKLAGRGSELNVGPGVWLRVRRDAS